MNYIELPEPLVFDWDVWNKNKIYLKHGISHEVCEEVFNSNKTAIFFDLNHSQQEDRYILIGQSKDCKNIYIVFTIRNNSVRVISARNMHKKEIKLYEKKTRPTKI